MRVLIVLALVAAAYANIAPTADVPEFSIIEKFLIPLGEKIRAAEEQISQDRIVGGLPSNLGQFPYQAGLLASYQNVAGTGVCGGVLVTANRVLTAAHCWSDGINQAWRFTVVLGSITLFSGGTRLDTSAVALHPQWTPSLIRNDIAMIYLPSNVAFSATIGPIALPTGAELNLDFAGYTAVASGFGLTTNNGNISVNQFLSYVTLNVISNSVCRFAFPLLLQDSNVCTSSVGGASTCRGDSGGPLATFNNGRQVLIGLTSFGSALGCESGMPASYVRVTAYNDFINQNL